MNRGQEGGDERIQSAGEKGGGAALAVRRVMHRPLLRMAHFFAGFIETVPMLLIGQGKIGFDMDAFMPGPEETAFGERLNAGEKSMIRGCGGRKAEKLSDSPGVQNGRNGLQQGLEFRPEIESAVPLGVEKGTDAHGIPGEKRRIRHVVIDCQGKAAVYQL